MTEKDKVMVTFGVEEFLQERTDQEQGPEGSERTVPASPAPPVEKEDKVHVDDILRSEEGREWYKWWSAGEMDDAMILKKYGSDGLEVFYAAKVMSQEVEATLPLPKEEFVRTMENKARLVESDEERRAREVMEDTMDARPGYVEVQDAVHEGASTPGGTAPTGWDGEAARRRERVQECKMTETEDDGGEMDEGENQEGDETDLMQRDVQGYPDVLNRLLQQLEAMPADRAGRIAEFLAQHLADLRRPAPHLYRPGLMERQSRLEALLSVFLNKPVDICLEEQQWCINEWRTIRPFLESGQDEGESSVEEENLETGEEAGREHPAEAENQVVAIEDSQESVQEGGSHVQVARLNDGSVRNLSQEEVEMMQWAEAVEDEAAEDERRREQARWQEMSSAPFLSWAQ